MSIFTNKKDRRHFYTQYLSPAAFYRACLNGTLKVYIQKQSNTEKDKELKSIFQIEGVNPPYFYLTAATDQSII